MLGHDPERVAVKPLADWRLPRLAALPADGLEDARAWKRKADFVQRLHQRVDDVLGGCRADLVLVDAYSRRPAAWWAWSGLLK
jgi:hypothetical protein